MSWNIIIVIFLYSQNDQYGLQTLLEINKRQKNKQQDNIFKILLHYGKRKSVF